MANSISRPNAIVFSDASLLTKELTRSLQKENCDVTVFTNDPDFDWGDVAVVTDSQDISNAEFNYGFIVDLSKNEKNYFGALNTLTKNIRINKLTVVLSYQQILNKAKSTNDFLKSMVNPDTRLVFVGNVVYETSPYFDQNFFDYDSKKIILPRRNKQVYFSDTSGLVDYILKATFSFSDGTSRGYFTEGSKVSEIRDLVSVDNVQWQEEKLLKPRLSKIKRSKININMINDRIKSLLIEKLPPEEIVDEKITVKASKKSLKKFRIHVPNKIIYPIVFVALIFVLSSVLYLFSFGITRYNVDRQGTSIWVNKTAYFISHLNSRVYGIYDVVFGSNSHISNLYNKSLVYESINTYRLSDHKLKLNADLLVSSILGESVNDPKEVSESIRSSLDLKYKSVEFLKGDLGSEWSSGLIFTKLIETDSSKINESRKFLSTFATILGFENQSEYFVVIQDSDSLTPTGGKIVGGVYLSFDDGRLTNQVLYTNFEIDGKTKGQREYLKAFQVVGLNPSFANSNTMNTFNENVQETLWYLDNSLEIVPDGVVYINKSSLSELVAILISEDQKNFNNLDTDELTKKFVEGLESPSGSKGIVETLLTGLASKDIIVWFADEEIQTEFEKLVQGVTNPNSECVECLGQDLYFSETRVDGVGNSNGLTRSADLTINIEEGIVKSSLTFSYEIQGELPQRVYLRLTAPKRSSFSPISIAIRGNTSYISPDLYTDPNSKTAGVLVDLTDKTSINYSWEYAFQDEKVGKLLNWYMQPGVDTYPISLSLNGKYHFKFLQPNLTNTGSGRYNTDSSSDIVVELIE